MTMQTPSRVSQATSKRGFTLIETLAAIALITVAIVAPMALTVQSLQVAYYARDQITASNLAQEGIEAIRSVRDANILAIARGSSTTNLFQNIIPVCSAPLGCYVDARIPDPPIISCGGACPVLDANATSGLYGYQTGDGWVPTNFTRTITATTMRSDSTGAQEIRITVVVSWKTAAYKSENITLSENLYNWVATGVGS